MNSSKITITIVAFASYLIIGGFLTQTGVLIQPISDLYNISVSEAASMFSILTLGTLIGTLSTMKAFEKFSLRKTFIVFYTLILLCLFVLTQTNDYNVARAMFLLVGIGCGVGLSAGAVIITKTYSGKARAIGFVGTDCGFSLAGFIFPALTSMAIAYGISWKYGFSAVAFAILFVLIASFVARYPAVSANENDSKENTDESTNIWTPSVVFIGVSLTLYLVSQGSFLAWAPSYISEHFEVSALVGSEVLARFWGTSIFGLVTTALIITKIPYRLYVCFVCVSVSFISLYMIMYIDNVDDFLLASSIFGFFSTSIFKLIMTIGTEQLKNPPAKLVTVFLLFANAGSLSAPALSGWVVEATDSYVSGLWMAIIGFILSSCLIFLSLIMNSIKRKATNHAYV